MSGNVDEFTNTLHQNNYYGSFERYGGSYGSSSSGIGNTDRIYTNTDYQTSSYNGSGFRLILTCK